MSDIDNRSGALIPKGETFGQRARDALFKIALVVLAFMLAFTWTDAAKALWLKIAPVKHGGLAYYTIFALIITIIAFVVAVYYAQISNSSPTISV